MQPDMYSETIIALSKEQAFAGRLENPDCEATAHNPLCGDRVGVSLRLDSGRIAALRYEVRGCLLCAAACARLAPQAAGLTRDDLAALREAFKQSLEKPETGFPEGYEIFQPVSGHRSRHSCVLLPFDALLEAFDK